MVVSATLLPIVIRSKQRDYNVVSVDNTGTRHSAAKYLRMKTLELCSARSKLHYQ